MERDGSNKFYGLKELFFAGSSQTSVWILLKGIAPGCIPKRFRSNWSVLRPFNNFPNNPHAGSR